MSVEKPEFENKDITFKELQEFINDPGLDLPQMRRDLSEEANIRWLLRNIMIRNKDAVPENYWEALKNLDLKNSE